MVWYIHGRRSGTFTGNESLMPLSSLNGLTIMLKKQMLQLHCNCGLTEPSFTKSGWRYGMIYTWAKIRAEGESLSWQACTLSDFLNIQNLHREWVSHALVKFKWFNNHVKKTNHEKRMKVWYDIYMGEDPSWRRIVKLASLTSISDTFSWMTALLVRLVKQLVNSIVYLS
jgi:hypothetical protein